MGNNTQTMCPAAQGDELCPATINELNQMPIKALKYFLQSRNVSIAAISEKAELIALLERTSQQEPESCDVCSEAGSLLICDGCMHGFHLTCLGLTESNLPDGDWFCVKCEAALATLRPAAAKDPAPIRMRVKKSPQPDSVVDEDEDACSEKEEDDEDDYEESPAKKQKKKPAKKASKKEKPAKKKREDTPETAEQQQSPAPAEQSPKKRLKKKNVSMPVYSSSTEAPSDLIAQIEKAIPEIISSHDESEELLTG